MVLSAKVSLHDVEDVEAFVIMCIKRSGCNAPSSAWDDLICEGICLLYKMASNYKPRLDGYTQDGRFSGYAVKWLPKQILKAWHTSHEHHLYTKDPITKKRGWTYRLAPVSFEMINNGDQTNQEVRMHTMKHWIDIPRSEE